MKKEWQQLKPNAPFMFSDTVDNYLSTTFFNKDDDLVRLKAQTDRMPERKMQITSDQGHFLSFLIRAFKLKNILEIGVYTGTSSLYMAKALPEDGKIIALDSNPEWTKIAKKHWNEAGISHKIDFRLGKALDILPSLGANHFDLVFIDADKKNYPAYYEWSLKLLNETGMIVIDNLFMNGKVLADPDDSVVTMMKEFHVMIAHDERVEFCFLPFYDGVALLKKKG